MLTYSWVFYKKGRPSNVLVLTFRYVINLYLLIFRKTWFVFRALELEKESASLLKDSETDIVFLRELLIG